METINIKISIILFDFLNDINNKSNEIYNLLFKDYLQEQSYSFGFKPLSDLYTNIIEKLDKYNTFENFSYMFYEKTLNKEYSKDILLKDFLKETKNINTDELLNLLIESIDYLNKSENNLNENFKKFFEFELKNQYLSFKPIFELKINMLLKLNEILINEKKYINFVNKIEKYLNII